MLFRLTASIFAVGSPASENCGLEKKSTKLIAFDSGGICKFLNIHFSKSAAKAFESATSLLLKHPSVEKRSSVLYEKHKRSTPKRGVVMPLEWTSGDLLEQLGLRGNCGGQRLATE